MTVYFSVLPLNDLEWAQREAEIRGKEQDAVERGLVQLATVKKRRSYRRRAEGFGRAKVRELLAEVSQ